VGDFGGVEAAGFGADVEAFEVGGMLPSTILVTASSLILSETTVVDRELDFYYRPAEAGRPLS